jgi:urease accessory protein
VVLTTQATTKVFKSEGSDCVTQSFDLTVGAGATLAFLPDPVTCFERARYHQTQAFRLAKGANLVFVDWLTSGRKRNYLTTGAVLESRKEILEHWDFDEYDNTAEIFVDGERLLTDRVHLAGAVPADIVDVRTRRQGLELT